MADFKKIFMTYLEKEGVRYADLAETVIHIPFSSDNLKNIPLFISFDNEGEPLAQIKCFEIANFKGKEEIGVQICNQLNHQYRWVKFCLDEDADIIASIDTYLDENTCGFVCLSLVRRAVVILNEAYPMIARAMQG